MTYTTYIFLQLLRASLWTEKIDAINLEKIDLSELKRLCYIHGVGPLIYDQLLRYENNPQRKLQLRQLCALNMLQQDGWTGVIQSVWDTLEQQGIKPIMLKGFGLARLYQRPHLRQWGDLDVWVGVENYHKACQLMRELYPGSGGNEDDWDELKHFHMILPDGHNVEVHRVTMEFAAHKDWQYWHALEVEAMASGVQQIELVDRKICLPEERFNMLFTFLHAWEHFCGTGIPLKQLCDLALMAHNVSDRTAMEAYLSKHLKALSLMQVWRNIGYAVTLHTGLPAEEWPLGVAQNKRSKALADTILTEGNSRKKHATETDPDKAFAEALKMPLLKRKWITLQYRLHEVQVIYPYAPAYACHLLNAFFEKGIRRTLNGSRMVKYGVNPHRKAQS